MTDHYAAAEAALDAARNKPSQPTRTELLLEAIALAVLATAPPREEPAEPPTLAEQLLAIIRRDRGQWTGYRAQRALGIAGVEVSKAEATAALKELQKAGYVHRFMDGASSVVLKD